MRQLFDDAGDRVFTLREIAIEIGKTDERVRQYIRMGRVVRDDSFSVKLYRIADGYAISKGRISKSE